MQGGRETGWMGSKTGEEAENWKDRITGKKRVKGTRDESVMDRESDIKRKKINLEKNHKQVKMAKTQ